MEFSGSLTAQLYLLAYDTRKQRLQRSIWVVELLRAAALADLQFCGRLADQAGKVQVSSREPVGEPVLDAVLQRIIKSKPRSWQQWVSLGGGFHRTVQDRLATLQVIKLEQRRILHIFPSTRIIVYQPHRMPTMIKNRRLWQVVQAVRLRLVARRASALILFTPSFIYPVDVLPDQIYSCDNANR